MTTPQEHDQDTPDSYEEARAELVEVVRRLESGGTDLEESLALWERGERLAQAAQRWLDGARERLAAAVASADGDPDADAEEDSKEDPEEDPDEDPG